MKKPDLKQITFDFEHDEEHYSVFFTPQGDNTWHAKVCNMDNGNVLISETIKSKFFRPNKKTALNFLVKAIELRF